MADPTCRECAMCGGCETHDDCITDPLHIEWWLRFASPGEPVCGVTRDGVTCLLVAGHVSRWHQNPYENAWRVTRG